MAGGPDPLDLAEGIRNVQKERDAWKDRALRSQRRSRWLTAILTVVTTAAVIAGLGAWSLRADVKDVKQAAANSAAANERGAENTRRITCAIQHTSVAYADGIQLLLTPSSQADEQARLRGLLTDTDLPTLRDLTKICG